MKVYKFGGTSVKDASGVRNLKKVLQTIGYDNTVLVISAMGKMTNAFEHLVAAHLLDDEEGLEEVIQYKEIKDFHLNMIKNLFDDGDHPIFEKVEDLFDDLNGFLFDNNSSDYDYVYDQIVSYAELLSTKICSAYLSENGIKNKWLDIRKCIKTDDHFRQANVDWKLTSRLLKRKIKSSALTITQGFIAGDNYGKTTTLGREGSDYSAAIIAYCIDAKEITIFKDVSGVLSADPREFENTVLLHQISYKEAVELAFFGASVIHPKTLQPLQKKKIPLRVKSFVNPLGKGTLVTNGVDIEPKIPCFILKKDQILISISDKDFHFIMEDDISEIFDYLHQYSLKVNLIQNSAISFTVCVEDNFNNFGDLVQDLNARYKVLYNKNLTLYTIRHFTDETIKKIEKGKKVFIKQLSRETVQIVVQN